jgi:regulator of protease activity HflC (stomatin/prohibitin superfamily)
VRNRETEMSEKMALEEYEAGLGPGAGAVPPNDGSPDFRRTTTSRIGALAFRVILALVVLAACAVFAWQLSSVWLFVVGLVLGALVFLSTHIILEWEHGVVLRFGKLNRVRGPGIFFTIPLVEYLTAVVDLRLRSTVFKAERVLTSDLVPVNVDAVLFWLVWDAGKACTEIKNFEESVFWISQTTLRDVIGGMSIAQMSTRRVQLDKEVKSVLETKMRDWGITTMSVEIRDIVIPMELQNVMSVEAQAEREYSARVILAEVEKEISEMFVDAARIYKQEDAALQLRAMSFVSNSVKDKGGLVVIPSGLSDAFDGLERISKGGSH